MTRAESGADRKRPYRLRCHALLEKLELVCIDRNFSTLKAAHAVARTLIVSLTPRSATLVMGGRWTITGSADEILLTGSIIRRECSRGAAAA